MTDLEIEKIHTEIVKMGAETQKIHQQMKYYPYAILAMPFALAAFMWGLKNLS